MAYVMVDLESDGPYPGEYSMLCFGAVVVEPGLDRTFYARLKPISDKFQPEALKTCHFTREETLTFPEPQATMETFRDWLKSLGLVGHPHFISENNGFDWQFMNWYFHRFLGTNPFGQNSSNLSSLYKGMEKDVHAHFRHLRKTPHTFNPLDDAKGNAEVLLAMKDTLGLKIKLS